MAGDFSNIVSGVSSSPWTPNKGTSDHFPAPNTPATPLYPSLSHHCSFLCLLCYRAHGSILSSSCDVSQSESHTCLLFARSSSAVKSPLYFPEHTRQSMPSPGSSIRFTYGPLAQLFCLVFSHRVSEEKCLRTQGHLKLWDYLPPKEKKPETLKRGIPRLCHVGTLKKKYTRCQCGKHTRRQEHGNS